MRSLSYFGASLLLAGLACIVALPGADAKVAAADVQQVPFIFWGGDVATFMANGGLETTPDSFYGKKELKIKLVPGDDFEKQIKDYLDGKSNFLRGTLSMLGQASEQLTAKPETTPVVFMQLTWSEGDHMVGRPEFKTLNDLKGKKIALQEGGPHVGMLNDILNTTHLTWGDIKVVWTKEVSGDKGPAAAMRKDNSIDACFAISPEMFGLTSAPATGGTDSVGDGTKDSVKGAHVIVSTAHMSRSIADVYACRSDFYKANREWVDKFVAGYLNASEELFDVKNKAGEKDAAAKDKAAYEKIQKLAQGIWTKDPAFKDAVAKLEDVDGLISDAVFVGLPGNKSFFKDTKNLVGFPFKQKQACALPADPSKDALKKGPKMFEAADLSYDDIRKLGDLRGKDPVRERFSKDLPLPVEGASEGLEIYRFKLSFKPNEFLFEDKAYDPDFQRALEVASLFANSLVVIRGHADPSLMVQRFLNAGTSAGTLSKDGDNYTLVDGKKALDPGDTKTILGIIAKDTGDKLVFTEDGSTGNMRGAVKALQDLSDKRAKRVQTVIGEFATSHNLSLDKSQIRTEAIGAAKPVVGFPKTEEDMAKNRRVEFIIFKVPEKYVNKNQWE